MAAEQQKAVIEPLLVSAGEAAGLLSVSRSHFLSMNSAGKIPLAARQRQLGSGQGEIQL